MPLTYFFEHLFDLLNESDLLDVREIEKVGPFSYRVTVFDGSSFIVSCQAGNTQTDQ